jgi:hypothetical protein
VTKNGKDAQAGRGVVLVLSIRRGWWLLLFVISPRSSGEVERPLRTVRGAFALQILTHLWNLSLRKDRSLPGPFRLQQPALQDFQKGWVKRLKLDTHAAIRLRMYDRPASLEESKAADYLDQDRSARGKGIHGNKVASVETQVGDTGRELNARFRFDELGGPGERVPGSATLLLAQGVCLTAADEA